MASLSLFAVITALSITSEARKCQDITIPVSISARNGVFDLAIPATDIEVVNFFLNGSRQGHNYTAELLTGYETQTGDYEIAATYCMPDAGYNKDSIVQICTHGIGFDRSYWDFPYNNYGNSYVATAVDQYGFSTLTYDRLGIGMSSHGNPLTEIQAPLEIAALHALTAMLRAGTIPGVSNAFTKVIHIGHSFGSAQTYDLTLQYPTDPDAVVLTGFSLNYSFLGEFSAAAGAAFIEANKLSTLSNYPLGYFVASTIGAVQWNYFAPGQFDPAVLEIAYTTGKPVTVGEVLTLTGNAGVMNPFAGPVLVITGERDVPYCGGDCNVTGDPALASIPAAIQMYYPSTTAFETYIVPATGHGINLHYNAQLAYHVIQKFLLTQGLNPQ